MKINLLNLPLKMKMTGQMKKMMKNKRAMMTKTAKPRKKKMRDKMINHLNPRKKKY